MDVESENAKAIAEIKRRAHLARVTPAKICDRAKVARQTFWRAEKEPGKVTVETLGKLEDALAAFEAERVKA